jgi:DnaK suppressor protein
MRDKVKKHTTSDRKTASKVRSSATKTDGANIEQAGLRQSGPDSRGKSGDSVQAKRREALHLMLTKKRQEILAQIKDILGQSVTDDEQRRSESSKDVGDQAMMDLERELGISLLEMQNRKRQLIDEALTRVAEGSYGVCAECGAEISERRLEAVPFAKLCVECQSKQELIEKIEKGEERD